MSCTTQMRVIDSFFAPMVAKLWSKKDASDEEIARLAQKLSALSLPDDVVRKAEEEALKEILAD